MRRYFSIALIWIIFGLQACKNPGALVDEHFTIENTNWTYVKPVQIKFTIEDTNIPYHIFINLRHTADYKYANIFLRIRQINPDRKTSSFRKEYRLANPDGEWLGKGSGNLYGYLLPLHFNYRFPLKGTYVIEIEQNMRDNPLREISEVGLRVERAN